MDADLSGTPAPSSHQDFTRKKRPPHSDDSSDLSEAIDDRDDYTLVMSRRNKRRMRKALHSSGSSTSTIITTAKHPLTVVYTPVTPADNLMKINKRKLSTFLETLAPGQIKEARLNPLRNVVAVDTDNPLAVEALLQVTTLSNIPVRPYIPRGPNTTVGVISGVDVDITDDDILKEMSAPRKIIQVRRLGTSSCVKIVFVADCLPSHVKVGLVRYPVRAFVPRATQCVKCWAIGHVVGVCEKPGVCSRCGGAHDQGRCTTEIAKCVNCDGSHDAKSKDCPRLKKEATVLKRMVRDNSTHREASVVVRRIRSRKRSKVATHSRQATVTASSQPPVVVSQSGPPSRASLRQTPQLQHTKASFQPRSNGGGTVGWPTLPSLIPPAPVPAATLAAHEQQNSSQDASDQQISNMLKTLVSVLRDLIGKKHTPMAIAATQVLDALIPILGVL